jgi:hypothetical protein
MKSIVIISLHLLFLFIAQGQKPIFQIKFSEPLAIFEFVNQLSANAPNNPFKTIFEQSKYNTAIYKSSLIRFDQLHIDYSYEYTQYPYAQKIGGSTISLLKKQLLNAQTIPEFKINSLGIVPNTDLFALSAILLDFQPVYLELIYLPNQVRFEEQLSELKQSIQTKDVPGFFELGLAFYHSSWDLEIPFQMAFYPLPNSKGFTATAFYNNTESAIPTTLQDYNKLLSVTLHEIFHLLYDEQSLIVKSNIEKWFVSNPSRNSRYAYLLLNETLATALGNGYVYGKLIGKEDTAMWYRRKYTNLMAKTIYPLLKQYIQFQKSIDESFINDYIQLYDQNFSGWLLEMDNIMGDRYVISDNADGLASVNSKFPYRSMSETDDQITESSLAKMKDAPITKLIIISKDNKNKLQSIKRNFIELANWRPNDQIDFVKSAFLSDKTFLIIINNIKKTIQDQIEKLKIE